MANEDIGKLIYDETERRLAEMQSPDYEFPTKAAPWNWVVIVATIAISIVGVALCMMGVIE